MKNLSLLVLLASAIILSYLSKGLLNTDKLFENSLIEVFTKEQTENVLGFQKKNGNG